MLRIGLTRFDEHTGLTGKPRNTLAEYASYLPLVELDTAYYAIPKRTTVENWLTQVPPDFRFIIKGYAGLTTQQREDPYFTSTAAMAAAFLESFQPLLTAGKLFCFLLQFPAYFTCTKEHVAYLRYLRQLLGPVPIALEFRDGSWYQKDYLPQMLEFMTGEQFSLGVIDEPHVANRSVPFVPYVTNADFAMLRLHGRNRQGWQEKGSGWEKKRTLYDYSQEELQEIQAMIAQVQSQTKEVAVIFNNNSGGHAAGNALALLKALGIEYRNLNPKQLGLFE